MNVLRQRNRGTLSTIDEELFRDDPITFPLFGFALKLHALKILIVIYFQDIFQLLQQLVHLIPMVHLFNHYPIQYIYFCFMGINFFMASLCIYMARIRCEIQRYSKAIPLLWIFVRVCGNAWDFIVTLYAIVAANIDQPAPQFYIEFLLYFDLGFCLYSSLLSIWIYIAVKRIRLRGVNSLVDSFNQTITFNRSLHKITEPSSDSRESDSIRVKKVKLPNMSHRIDGYEK